MYGAHGSDLLVFLLATNVSVDILVLVLFADFSLYNPGIKDSFFHQKKIRMTIVLNPLLLRRISLDSSLVKILMSANVCPRGKHFDDESREESLHQDGKFADNSL